MGLFLGFLSCSIGLYFCFCANTTLSWSMVAAMEQKCGQEELPHVQGKEQWLRFTGAAVKKCPTSKVRETQVRR